MKTRTWALLLGALLLVSAALSLLLLGGKASGTVANIYRDGVCLRSIDLAAVTESFTFTVSDEAGENVIEVSPGRIRVLSADCPDQVCVRAGWLSDAAAPIVCLPHRLVIRIEGSAAAETADAVSR